MMGPSTMEVVKDEWTRDSKRKRVIDRGWGVNKNRERERSDFSDDRADDHAR
jgi:hypothetical protein